MNWLSSQQQELQFLETISATSAKTDKFIHRWS
jgi:hypothetical protein